jgi:hypothetical protein
MRKTYRRKGGAATSFPLKYFDNAIVQPMVQAGNDMLKSVNGVIRPQIGGRRKRHTKKRHMTHRKKGGFLPSIMGNFTAAASKYIVPIALFSGYKLMTRKRNNKSRRS